MLCSWHSAARLRFFFVVFLTLFAAAILVEILHFFRAGVLSESQSEARDPASVVVVDLQLRVGVLQDRGAVPDELRQGGGPRIGRVPLHEVLPRLPRILLLWAPDPLHQKLHTAPP